MAFVLDYDLDLHLWNLGGRVVVIYTGKKGNKAKSPRYLCSNISYVGWKRGGKADAWIGYTAEGRLY